MVVFSGNLSGSFVSTGAPIFLPFPTGVDFITVTNQTNAQAALTTAAQYNSLVTASWQSGGIYTNGTGIQTAWNSATTALTSAPLAAGQGFFYQDTAVNQPGALVATTAISADATPVVSTGTTTGLVPSNSIVRLYNPLGTLQFGGIDFTIGSTIFGATNFQLAYAPQVAVSALAGAYRIIPYNPYFYPATRTITNVITSGNASYPGMTDVIMSVTHNYVVGQKVRFHIPTLTATYFGIPALDGLSGTILAVTSGGANSNTTSNLITVDINFAALGGTFAWPLTTSPLGGLPQVVPYGANTAVANAADITNWADATLNTAARGLLLMPTSTSNSTGLTSNGPAGYGVGQLLTWTAGKSFNQ